MQILYTFITSLFFGGLFFYLINYALIPYTSEKIVDIKNLIIVSISLVLFVTTFFSIPHQIIDKLFFKKFYEKPRIFLALRRGFLLGLLLAGLAWLRIFGFWQWHIVVLVVVLILLFEALFVSFTSRRGSTDKGEGK